MSSVKYRYIQLFRDVNSERSIIDSDLVKLGEFIRHRASVNKNISYYITTYMDNDDVNGYIIIAGENEDAVDNEAELVVSYIDSSLTSIFGKILGSPKHFKNIPLPVARNFS